MSIQGLYDRPCIDYRTLNNISVKFRNPLPLVPAALEYLRGATIFNKLDLCSTCNLIRERDEWKTAFVTLPATMNIWLCHMTWSTVFQDFMHEVLGEYLHRFILVYIDDILIYSRSLAEHRNHVAEVLQWWQHQLFLKAEKCSFHQSTVQFLRYHIDSSGIRMDKGKVEAIRTRQIPSTIKELQRFLGFCNFCRRFIQNYSTLTSPLTNLLRNKPKSLSWSPAANDDFESLKEAFTQAPILIHPDPQRSFIHCQGWCFNYGSRSDPILAAGEPRETPSMCLLTETKPGGTQLRYRQQMFVCPIQWNPESAPSSNDSSATPPGSPQGVQYVTRTQRTLIHSVHWPPWGQCYPLAAERPLLMAEHG